MRPADRADPTQACACVLRTQKLMLACGRRLQQLGKQAFGPYGGCQGQRFPFRQCQLKNQTDPMLLRTYEAGDLQPYVSGLIAGAAAGPAAQ